MRYLALPCVGALALAVFVVLLRIGYRIKRVLGYVLLCVTPFALTFSVLAARNLHIAGSLTGLWAVDRETPVGVILEQFFRSVGSLVLPLGGGIAALFVLTTMVALSVLTMLSAKAVYSEGWSRSVDGNIRLGLAIFGVGACFLTIALILVLSVRSTAFSMDARYIAPTIPLMIIAVTCLISEASAVPTQFGKLIVRLETAVVLGLVGFSGINVFQWQARMDAHKETGEVFRVMERTRIGDESVKAFLARESTLSAPVMSNQSQLLYLAIRKPTIGVPIRRLSARDWKTADIKELAKRFGVHYFLIFKRLHPGGEGRASDFLSLVLIENPPWLAPVVVNEDVALLCFDPSK